MEEERKTKKESSTVALQGKELLRGTYHLVRVRAAERVDLGNLAVKDDQGKGRDLLAWIWETTDTPFVGEPACTISHFPGGEIKLGPLVLGEEDEAQLKYEDVESLVGDFHRHPRDVDPGLLPDVLQLISRRKALREKAKFVRLITLGNQRLTILVKTGQPIREERELALEEILTAMDREEEAAGTWSQDDYLERYAAIADPLGVSMFILERGGTIAYRVERSPIPSLSGDETPFPDLSFLDREHRNQS